ncbi:hypothetical protein [Actinomyces radicidentis]|uniref:hypothetical protein n=1 Tax=Actinomyces radicidentis TaxID=111015 RepID=UPI0026E0B5E9|nr:hypothetical protein [Actinomyces radicidentis]
MKSRTLAILAALAIVVGVVLVLIPRTGSAPEVTCLDPSASVWTIQKDGESCTVSQADYESYSSWRSGSSMPFHWAGWLLVVTGVCTGIGAGVIKRGETLRRRVASGEVGEIRVAVS